MSVRQTPVSLPLSAADARYLKLDQTTPQTTVGTFTFPFVNTNGTKTATAGSAICNVNSCTLQASANGDYLYAFTIFPNYTTYGYTGVKKIAIACLGSVAAVSTDNITPAIVAGPGEGETIANLWDPTNNAAGFFQYDTYSLENPTGTDSKVYLCSWDTKDAINLSALRITASLGYGQPVGGGGGGGDGEMDYWSFKGTYTAGSAEGNTGVWLNWYDEITSRAARFTDATNTVDLCDQTNAITATGPVSITGTLGAGATTITSLSLNDTNTQITEDGSGNMILKDAVAGSIALVELSCPPLVTGTESTVAEGNNNVTLSPVKSKVLIKYINIVTTSTDWTLTLYTKDDFATGTMVVVTNRSGNYNVYLDYPYEDADASGELHYNFTSASGSETHDIEIRGYALR